MSVGELKAKLSEFPDKWEVFIDYEEGKRVVDIGCQLEVIGVFCIDENEVGLQLEG